MDNKTFSQWYAENTEKNKINESSWFGIIGGLVLTLVGVYQALCTDATANLLFKALAFIGLAVVIIAVIFPKILYKPMLILKSLFSFFGGFILKIVLLPVYIFMMLINLFIRKGYKKKFRFVKWDDAQPAKSFFADCENTSDGKGNYTTSRVIGIVMSFFAGNQLYIVIPVIVVLLILGSIAFFASSHAVFSFVYTLF